MSHSKITPKNLSYDTSLPPFLQRLRGEFTGPGDGRHERAIARPKRARDADADAEDEPIYVDEETNHTLSKEEYAALVGNGDETAAEPPEQGDSDVKVGDGHVADGEVSKAVEKEKLAAIGGGRKRKVGKIVGGTSQEDKESENTAPTAKSEPKDGDGKTIAAAKAKKKGKKIKLSFNDD